MMLGGLAQQRHEVMRILTVDAGDFLNRLEPGDRAADTGHLSIEKDLRKVRPAIEQLSYCDVRLDGRRAVCSHGYLVDSPVKPPFTIMRAQRVSLLWSKEENGWSLTLGSAADLRDHPHDQNFATRRLATEL